MIKNTGVYSFQLLGNKFEELPSKLVWRNPTFRWRLDSAFMSCVCVFCIFFFFLEPWLLTFLCKQCTPMGPVHCSRDPQTSLLSNFFIKNESHGTIHTFKNYFTTVFLVFSKISCIQTDLLSLYFPPSSCFLFLFFFFFLFLPLVTSSSSSSHSHSFYFSFSI